MRSIFALRALWLLQVGITIAAFCVNVWVGVITAVLALGLPALGLLVSRYGMFDVDKLAVLERPGHPELFKLVDEAAARIGTATFDRLYIANAANAWAARVEWERSVILGMPNLPFYDVSDLVSTLAHELAHHSANDVDDPEVNAHTMLSALGNIPFYPLFPVARALAHVCGKDAAAGSRERERAADFWSSLVAGRGSLEASLRIEGRVAVLWEWLERDLFVLAEQKQRPRNVYNVLRTLWARAEEDGYLTDIDDALESGETLVDDTHPSFRERVDDNDRLCSDLVLPERLGLSPAQRLFPQMEALELEMTEYLEGPEDAAVVDEMELDRAFSTALEAHVRKAMKKYIGPRAEHVSAVEMLSLAAPALLREVKRSGDDDDDQSLRESPVRRLLARAIDLAVARGELRGTFRFGSARTVIVGNEEWYVWHAAKRLLRGEVPWHALRGVTCGRPKPAREVSGVHGGHALPQAAKTR